MKRQIESAPIIASKICAAAERKIDAYFKGAQKYGILALCFLINEFEKEELYEECALIIKSIDRLSEQAGTKLPSRLNKNAIEWVCERLRANKVSKEVAQQIVSRAPYYANIIKSQIFYRS